MGYLLKEALKTLCGVNQWSYAVFWKIGSQNSKLLTWDECYYDPVPCYALPRISGIESPDLAFEGWEACWVAAEVQTSQHRVQAEDKVHSLINNMMMNNQVNFVGEGIVGRAAFTGNHQWILSENYTREVHPPEVLNEVHQQFSAGMQTVAVIPVLTCGVIQLGSTLAIMENIRFVNDVKTLILQLGCVPAPLSDNYITKEPAPKVEVPISLGKCVSSDLSGNYRVTDCTPFIADSCKQQHISSQAPMLIGQPSDSLFRQIQHNLRSDVSTFQTPNLAQSSVKSNDNLCRPKVTLGMKPDLPFISQLENRASGTEVISLNGEAWLNQQASLHGPRSEFDKQPSVAASSANCSSLSSMEEQIFSVGDVQVQANSGLSTLNGFMMSQQRTNEGLFSSSRKDSATKLLLEGSQLLNDVSSHLRSIPYPCSIPNAHRSANGNISCTRLVGGGPQNIGSSKTKVSLSDQLISGSSDHMNHSTDDRSTQNELAQMKEKNENELFEAIGIPLAHLDEHVSSREQVPCFFHDGQNHDYGNRSPRSKIAIYEDTCFQPPSGDDLFDILGVDFKNRLLHGSWSSCLSKGPASSTQNLGKNNSTPMNFQDTGSDLYSVNGGNSESGIFCMGETDHLLDAVVSRVHSTAEQISDDNVSCRTTSTKISSSSVTKISPSYEWVSASDQIQGELFGLPKALIKAGAVGSCSFRPGCSKDNTGSYSQSSSIYGSQIRSLAEQGNNMKHNSSVTTAYSKRPDEVNKSNRKRLKPGENPRPRPKDRQMIQDRVKELREIVPNGAKCSIDALLERTIKHMLFLQSVTKHADKLKQTGESKIIGREGGLLLKDNFEGGATWAYEVGSQSMVCPIIVEDLNHPRQMLVEMLCEERGLFLEIADIIRDLGLTILKGVMESRNDKIWACFAVEANRDVTRVEIFLSLVRLLEQTVESSATAFNGVDNDNMQVHQSYNQAASIHATGRPFSLQ